MRIIEQRKQLSKKIKKAKTIFIMAHQDLDLDALGSSIGFYSILEKMGKNCYLIIDDKRNELGVSKILKELDGCIGIIKGDDVCNHLYSRIGQNLLLILDTNKKELLQNQSVLDYFDEEHMIIIDHHDKGPTSLTAGLEIIDQEVSSTCEMVANLMECYQVKIDPYYSTLVLSGIVLDTNNFTLKTTEETYYAAYFSIRADEFDSDCMVFGKEKVKNKMKEIDLAGNNATTKDKNMYAILELVLEMYERGFEFLPIDLYKSHATKFLVEEGKIRPPLNSIPGLGTVAAEGIIKARQERKMYVD